MGEKKAPVNSLCPFCGNKGAIDTLNYTGGKPGKFRVQCQGCLAATHWCDTEGEAWEAWNKRYAEPAVFIFNQDAFVYESRLYYRDKRSGYCFAQKEFRGDLKRIGKKDFLLTADKAASARAERANTEYEKTTGVVKQRRQRER